MTGSAAGAGPLTSLAGGGRPGRVIVCVFVALVVLAGVGALSGAGAASGPNAGQPGVGVGADALAPASTSGAVDDPTTNQQRTTVTGTVEYRDVDGSMQPARGVDVQIRKQTGLRLPNPVIAETTTDENGEYEIQLDVADHENDPLGNDLGVRVQALASNDAIEVLGFSNNFQGGSGRIYHAENTGDITVGQATATFDISVTDRDTRRAFQVAEWALETREFTDEEAGYTRRQAKANLNASLYGDRYLAHLDKIKLSTDWDATKNFTIYHEYGHAVQDGLWNYEMWEPPHVERWLRNEEGEWFPCHAPASETSELYAWYEGFPEFMEAAVNGDAETDNMDLESRMYFNRTYTDSDCHDGDSSPRPDYDGERVEGAVANVLWDVYDGENEPHDDVNVSLREIFGTISKDVVTADVAHRNTRKVKNISAFWEQFRTDENHAALGRIYFEAGIQVEDKFEDNDRKIHAHQIRHGVTDASRLANGYPVDGWTWEDGAQQNYGDDEDHYRFPVMGAERVTVTINSTQGNADFDLGVYGPSDGIMGESETTGSNETVQFQAPKNGRYVGANDPYRIKVWDTESGRSAGTYVMNITVEPRSVYDDRFEENDAISSPASVGNGTYEDLKLTDFDSKDVFAVDLDADESVTVEADFRHSETDIDLYLYSPYLNSPSNAVVLERSTSETNDENLTWHADASGTHYVVVYDRGLDEQQVEYDLTVRIRDQPLRTYEDNDRLRYNAADLESILQSTDPAGDQVGTVTEGLTPGDVDYYEIDLNSYESVELNLQNGSGVTAMLMPANESFYYARVRSLTTRDYTRPGSTDTYYLRVTSTRDWVPRYDIEVKYGRGVGSDPLEPNNDHDQATSATPSIGVGNASGTVSWEESGYGYALAVAGDVGDEDYFEVDLASGEKLIATATYRRSKDLEMEIIGASGQIISATEVSSGELEASVTASTSGTFYVKVTDGPTSGEEIEYDLEIERQSSVGGSNPAVELASTLSSSDLVQTITNPIVGDAGSEDLYFLEPFVVGGGNGTGDCTLADTQTYTRTLAENHSSDTKIGKVRSYQVQGFNPCRVVVQVDGPRAAQVDVFVTLDGSRPTSFNYDVAGQQPGSQEALVLEPSDGLAQGVQIRALAKGYPVAGTYEVTIELHTRGP